jgi:hypothetical protein
MLVLVERPRQTRATRGHILLALIYRIQRRIVHLPDQRLRCAELDCPLSPRALTSSMNRSSQDARGRSFTLTGAGAAPLG